MLREQKGNMYEFVTHTWNAIKGKCSHDCDYCYMKEFGKLNPIRLDNKELKTDLGSDNFIFVGSSTDMFADDVNFDWITSVIYKCNEHNNKYLFQSKNVKRLVSNMNLVEKPFVVATTIETNRYYDCMGKTMKPYERAYWLRVAKERGYATMITIEPIMDFDIDEFVTLIKFANPTYLNIGADSKGHNLPEPSKEKVLEFIDVLTKNKIKIHNKENLKRILEKKDDKAYELEEQENE